MKLGTGRKNNMRILIDTNILFSALLFPHSIPAKALSYAAIYHRIVLCDSNISELKEILRRKAPRYLPAAEVLLTGLSYELSPSVDHVENLIRDVKDQPILNAAIAANVDIIVTGDKDFLSLKLKHPQCITATEFLANQKV